MTIFRFDPNNTEGAHPTAMVVDDAEIKKGDKIVATDIVDLYDTDINSPTNNQALTYATDVWINGEVTGGGESCGSFVGYDENGYINSIFINASAGSGGTGNYATPFRTLDEAFDMLRSECLVIPEDITLTIHVLSNLWLTENTSLNHPYGHRINIDCHNFILIATYNTSFNGNENLVIDSSPRLSLSGNHNVSIIDARFATSVSTDTDEFVDRGVVVHASCGGSFTMILKEDGTLWGTGYGLTGATGSGDFDLTHNFVQEALLAIDWDDVTTGTEHTLALKKDGSLWGCGLNNFGQLGLNDYVKRHTFERIGTDSWTSISAMSQTMAIKTDSTLWGCGRNDHGELGIDNLTHQNNLTQIQGFWKSVSCGAGYTMAIKTDGTLWGTGYNINGELGTGDNVSTQVFVQIGNSSAWKQVLGCLGHTMAIMDDGSLWSTGLNSIGQLGLGDTTNRNELTFIMNGCDRIYGDSFSTFLIKTDGTLWGCGGNWSGQLGLGDTTNRDEFVQIGTDDDVIMASGGDNHSVIVKPSGVMYGTGLNDFYRYARVYYIGSPSLEFIYGDGGVLLDGTLISEYNVNYYDVDLTHTYIDSNSVLKTDNVSSLSLDDEIIISIITPSVEYSVWRLNKNSIVTNSSSYISNGKVPFKGLVNNRGMVVMDGLVSPYDIDWLIKNDSYAIIESDEPDVLVHNQNSTVIINNAIV